MSVELRHYCRNPRCRSKLPAPVENEHHGFCTPGCHTSFYRSRCQVCEEPIRRKNERQRFGSGHKTCQNEYRRFPHVYDLPRREPPPSIGKCTDGPKSAHSTGLKTGPAGERPSHRCLRGWSWHSDECEHELRDANGTPLARIESNAGRHRLTHPRSTPILSWPGLDEAKHHAEALALAAIPSELSARIKRDNETPHRMRRPA